MSATPAVAPGGAADRDTRTRAPSRRLLLVYGGPALLALVGLGAWLLGGRYVESDNAYLKAEVVQVGPRVAGLVASVAARSNATVQAGDVLFTLDRAPLELAVARAEAALAAARADAGSLRATLDRRRAELAVAETTRAQAEREVARLEPLAARGIAPRVLQDRATYEAAAAREQVGAAERSVAETAAALGPAIAGAAHEHPRVRVAAAELEQARLDLAHATIRAPSAGTLATVTLHAGEHVEPGDAVLRLVADHAPWIEANLKETQLAQLAPGQPVTVTVDSYPGTVWRARVASIGPAAGAEFSLLPPDNASGNWVKVVQRVPVRLEFERDNPRLPLRAGTSVEIRIDTGDANVRWRRIAREWFGARP